ncbi:helix-turn-helix transcriptional regulator [Pseudomonas syringae]|uniref:helix-turn-helix domain-containing protein n=1 Tax=Pseudomonas syringae TaxID=317 RepID=UPI0018E61210|nr:helix-turn-helix transcriptional regulator [Pseudomonas syringae]
MLALNFSPPAASHNSKHTDFDDLLAELEADPKNAKDMADAGSWAADFLYPGEAETLRTARLRKGLSQKQLASLIGTSQPHIANLEKSGNDVMLSTAVKLCAALDIEFGCLPGMIDHQRSINSQKELK